MYILNSLGSLQHCNHVALKSCRRTTAISVPGMAVTHLLPGTHLDLRKVKYLRIKCLAQEHNIDTAVSLLKSSSM